MRVDEPAELLRDRRQAAAAVDQDRHAALRGEREMTIELRSSREPALFKSVGKVSYVYLLMPLRD